MVTFRKHAVHHPSRRAFLAGASAVAVGVAIDTFLIEPRWLDVTYHDVAIPKLPRTLEGFTIAQITDTHLTQIGIVEESIYRALRATDVQLLVLSGDMIDSALGLDALKRFCAELNKKGMTILATLGNWERWGRISIPNLADVYGDLNIRLLVNDGIRLDGDVKVFATDDATAGTPRIRKLYDNQAPATIFVTHSPSFLDNSALLPGAFNFALAGHTHGGQVRLGPKLVPFLPPGCGRFLGGWYDTPGGKAYVSRGTGTNLAQARFTCRPELPIFRLRQG